MMERYFSCWILIGLILMVFLFTSCTYERSNNAKDSSTMDELCINNFIADDSTPLEKALTMDYDLCELQSFFCGSKENENTIWGFTKSALSFGEVNRQYPVEVTRSGGYSVYKIKQGGYFYVFWVNTINLGEEGHTSEPYVYFHAYLPSSKKITAFDSLTPEISTAEDVQKIDSAFELSFLQSSGIFSYSYLDEQTILQIKYAPKENVNGYCDLIVDEMQIVPRASVPSRYSAIMAIDTP